MCDSYITDSLGIYYCPNLCQEICLNCLNNFDGICICRRKINKDLVSYLKSLDNPKKCHFCDLGNSLIL